MTTKKAPKKEIGKTIKEYGWPILKSAIIGTVAYVSADVLDAGIESVVEGLKSVNNGGMNTILNHPETRIIIKTIPLLTQSAFLYFLPRKYMNTPKQKGAEGGYYTEQILKYLMQGGAVLRGLEASTIFFGTVLPHVNSSASIAYHKFMSRVGGYLGLASLAVPILDRKNRAQKNKK